MKSQRGRSGISGSFGVNAAGGVKTMVQRDQSNPDEIEVGEMMNNEVKRTRVGVSSFSL
jgi:hypothetical protein